MKKEVLNEKSIVATTEQIARNNTDIHPLAPFVAKMFEAAIDKNERDVVIVCFGTNAISGDSLGPLVGTLLTKKYNIGAFVYGTDEAQINGKNTFENCSALTSIVLPTALTSLGGYAFANSGLTSITIPSKITAIMEGTFKNCKNLSTVTFAEGSNFTLVSYYAFAGSGITAIEFPATLATIQINAFENCKQLQKVTFAESATTLRLYDCAFAGCTAISEIVLPKNVDIQLTSTSGKFDGVFYGWTANQTIKIMANSRKFLAANAFTSYSLAKAHWNGGCNAKIVYEYVAE